MILLSPIVTSLETVAELAAASFPIPMLLLPVVKDDKAPRPSATLLLPVVLAVND